VAHFARRPLAAEVDDRGLDEAAGGIDQIAEIEELSQAPIVQTSIRCRHAERKSSSRMKADDHNALKREPFTERFREFIERLRGAGELVDLRQPVDLRHIAT